MFLYTFGVKWLDEYFINKSVSFILHENISNNCGVLTTKWSLKCLH